MLLKTGDKGIQVTYLQYALHIMCCSPGGIDGTFGAGTEAAVRKYQERHGLSVDGQVGDATWNSLTGEIKIIQRALSQKGYYSGYIDGVAGEGTYNAVIQFQTASGLAVDGQVGDATRAKLMGSGSPSSGSGSGFPLKQGSTGDNVLYLQYGLHIMCCSPGGIDGVFGSGTASAVMKFQSKYGLASDGIVGSATWSKLQSLIREIQNGLVNHGYNTNGVDGLAGPATYEAVIAFQRANGLAVDGQVGPATREKLLGTSSDGGSDGFPLKQGSQGANVLYLQNGLWIMCINPNGRDDIFGAGTEAAVRKFQTNYGLSVDGIVGTATWEKLRSVIRPIQQALVNHGYNTGGVDGLAGENTYNAVISFQKANGLDADGMVGSATKAKLGITSSGGGSGTTSATLSVGSNGSLTRYLQRMLNVLGYNIAVDGDFGDGTKNAVVSFQNKYGLAADGIVGSGTWSKLFSVYKVPVSGTGVQKMVNVAKHELSWGFAEDNSNNITPYGQWYGLQGGAWCAMFVSWCASQAGILGTTVPRYAYCPYGVNDYRAKGKFYSRSGGYTPRIGDTIFFWNSADGVVGHTGIVVGVTPTEVITIEGNASDAVRKKRYNRTNTYIHGYGCNDGTETSTVPAIKSPKNNAEYAKLPDSYKDSCNRQLNDILNSLNLLDISGKVKVPYTITIPVGSCLKVQMEVNVGANAKFMKDCNIELDLSDGDIKYHNQSIRDTLLSIASICNPDQFMKIAFTTNQGKYGFDMSIENGYINFKFVTSYEHEYDEIHSWTMEFAIIYSFKQDTLPSVISVAAEWVNNLVNDLQIKVSKKDIIIVAAIVVIILVLGPEIAAVIAGSAAIDSTVSALIAVVFNGIRSIL